MKGLIVKNVNNKDLVDFLTTKFIKKKYEENRDRFARVIDRWKEKGRIEAYSHASQLLTKLDELYSNYSGQARKDEFSKADMAALALQAKAFKRVYRELNEITKPVWRQWLEAIVVALVLAFVLRHTIFSPYHVPTGSAEVNILVGDRLWGNKMAYYFSDVKRGDLVIFDDPRPIYQKPKNIIQDLWQRYIGLAIPLLGLPEGPINVVKRCIAIPGDTIEGKIEQGRPVLYINGCKVEEPYLNPYPLIALRKTTGFLKSDSFGPFEIPGFLRQDEKIVTYSYDPEKSYTEQPFYDINADEVIIDPFTRKPIFRKPFTPNYERDQIQTYLSVDVFGPFTLPKNAYWVMGDSRKNSIDSRYWGILDRKYIRGRASFIIFSFDSEEVFWLFDVLKHPISFWTRHVRWSRFFKSLPSISPILQEKSIEK